MKPTEIQSHEYITHLLKDIPRQNQKVVLENAYKIALDTRKFEIELYWKRATYFWAFIGAIFIATYSMLNSEFLVGTTDGDPQLIIKKIIVILISILGFLFSLGWYFVNRGSKVWQENWETHISLLEDSLNGPLFKTLVKPNLDFWNLKSNYPFSVSKVNQILSLCVTVFWIVLINILIVFLFGFYKENCCWILSVLLTSIALSVIIILFHAQTVSFIYAHFKKDADSSKNTYFNRN